MDSYQKLAYDMFGKIEKPFGIFFRVKEKDLNEVLVHFALMVCQLENSDNYRIYPLEMKKEFLEVASRGCCLVKNSQIKCESGNIYWVGCNYGH